ncbi:MAG: 3'-5' exonuclease [Prevotellaceae bacterium]|nr:3'-5' exonuclease [Prevotellaceae bacterium]
MTTLNFTALDFETADSLIPCELGVCVVRDGIITETRSWLIKPSCFPYMNYWNENIHGISTRDLADAPYFDDAWKEIEPYIADNLLVAHNAAFDVSVLRYVLNYYGINSPTADYLCSVKMARRIWPDMANHRLNTLCQHFGIIFNHHRAGADAESCARITLKIANETQSKILSQPYQLTLFQEGLSLKEIARKLKVKAEKF